MELTNPKTKAKICPMNVKNNHPISYGFPNINLKLIYATTSPSEKKTQKASSKKKELIKR